MRNIEVNTKVLQAKIQRYKRALKDDAKRILFTAQVKGAEAAMRYAPPPPPRKGTAARNIPRQDYYRKGVFNIFGALKTGQIKTLYKGRLRKYAHEMREKLKEGYKYFVFKDTKKTSKVWYFKNRREAQKYLRIKYRGLMKVMYGLDLLKQGFTSNVFMRLLSKSPALKNLSQMSKIEYNESKDYYNATNHNKAINQSLANIGKNKSKKPIKASLKKQLNDFKQRYFSNKQFK